MQRARLAQVLATLAAIGALALAGCGGSSETDPDVAGIAAAVQENDVSADRAKTWPTEWCVSLHVGMNRMDAAEAMGVPTTGTSDYDGWDGFGYSFEAFYDENGTIRQLDWSDRYGMTAAQRAKLACAETRS